MERKQNLHRGSVQDNIGPYHENEGTEEHFTHEWVISTKGGSDAAKKIAQDLGYRYVGDIPGEKDSYYILEKLDHPTKSPTESANLTQQLNLLDNVEWAEQQCSKRLVKRQDPAPSFDLGQTEHQFLQHRNQDLSGESKYANVFHDEYWPRQWYMHDYRSDSEQPITDLNVVPVYYLHRVTGLGVNVIVPDDGVEIGHPDLAPNHDPELSIDLNGNTRDPTPKHWSRPNYHGTRCVGEIVMTANNDLCGVGVAFRAKFGGIRMLDGPTTDKVTGVALQHALHKVDIFSNSWGPSDDGKTCDQLGRLTREAFINGITKGRQGKGVIYVFAAGNGKEVGDNCACDGYVVNIYTIAVASCDYHGHVTHYSERCAAVMVTSYSGGGVGQNVATTDIHGGCTVSHTGTSAAAPLIAGVIALALEINPNLTWRDVQYLFAWTSAVYPLAENHGWYLNAAGFYYSPDFGFGLADGYNFVTAAKTWVNVPPKSVCVVPIRMGYGGHQRISPDEPMKLTVKTDACKGTASEINYLEHVQLETYIKYSRRGGLEITLESPAGTKAHMLESRPRDYSEKGFKYWTFTSLKTWGESANGNWTIEVFDRSGIAASGVITELTLFFHGVREVPHIYKDGRRPYKNFQTLDEKIREANRRGPKKRKKKKTKKKWGKKKKRKTANLSEKEVDAQLEDGNSNDLRSTSPPTIAEYLESKIDSLVTSCMKFLRFE
ncbi:neuroendocrine convertase 1 isoform X2 [Bemisia tabaci]|uniref:neuroendocrine convertase 1 isoform X2 n=1 Tax=Bemisia tabaci TaxID=7038 RepID=UPI003B281C56